jgi:hypothetical protein
VDTDVAALQAEIAAYSADFRARTAALAEENAGLRSALDEADMLIGRRNLGEVYLSRVDDTPGSGTVFTLTNRGDGPALSAVAESGVGLLAHELQLAPADAAGPPSSGEHEVGEVYADRAAEVYLCVAAGTPGVWRRLVKAGPGYNHLHETETYGIGFAGSVYLLDRPYRVFDSRPGSGAPLGGGGRVVNGYRWIPVYDARPRHGGPGVPRGSVGVLLTLAVTGTVGGGHMTINSYGNPSTSVLNWSGNGQTIATTTWQGLTEGGDVHVGVRGSAHVIVDAIGYAR